MTAQILVVDDEPDVEALVLQKFRHQIRDGAISFLFARDGVEALAVLKANGNIDLVVTDINMPRMDGLSLLQKLQESEESVSTIIVSAYGDMTNIRTAMNRGAFDFVTKPIDFLDLETTIAKTIGISSSCATRGSARRRPNGPMPRCRATSRRIWRSGLPAMRTPSILAGNAARSRRCSPTSPASPRLWRRWNPSVLGPLLNEYLTGMTDIVFAHDGTVAKIVGDALARAVWSPRRAARPCRPRGHLRVGSGRVRPGIPRALAQKGHCAGSHAHWRSCRTGDCRQFRRRPLLRLHGLWRHHQRCGAAGSCQQATRHPHMCQRKARGEVESSEADRSATLF